MEYPFQDIIARLIVTRRIKRISIKQLSHLTSISETRLRQIEYKNSGLTLSVFITLCEALDVSADFILYGTVHDDRYCVFLDDVLYHLPTEQIIIALEILDKYILAKKYY